MRQATRKTALHSHLFPPNPPPAFTQQSPPPHFTTASTNPDPSLLSPGPPKIQTTPKFAIGQRAALLRLPSGCGGNILWDCLALLDAATVARIRALGGLAAIAISHPHYYTTHLLWARTFGCPVYLAAEDRGWLAQADGLLQRFLEPGRTELRIDPEPPASPAPPPPPSPSLPSQGDDIDADPAASSSSSSVLLLKPGGHFPGSLVLLFDGHLLVADTLVTTPAGLGSWATDATGAPRRTGQPAAEPAAAAPVPAASDGGGGRTRPAGMNSFAFMWSIPNMIPLPPADLARMWDVLRRHDFTSTHGAFMGQDIEHVDVKRRVLQSMKIQVMGMGWTEHPFLSVDT